MTRWSKAGIVKPNPKYVLPATSSIPYEPKSVKSALRHSGWKNAMLDELAALHQIRPGYLFLAPHKCMLLVVSGFLKLSLHPLAPWIVLKLFLYLRATINSTVLIS